MHVAQRGKGMGRGRQTGRGRELYKKIAVKKTVWSCCIVFMLLTVSPSPFFLGAAIV